MSALLLQVPGFGIAVTVVVLAAALFLIYILANAVRIVQEYERGGDLQAR